MDGWTFSWLMWIAMFFAIEVPALVNKRDGDTLSEHVWVWFSITDKAYGWRSRRFTLLAFLAWLAAHFLSGGQF